MKIIPILLKNRHVLQLKIENIRLPSYVFLIVFKYFHYLLDCRCTKIVIRDLLEKKN